MVFYLLSSGLVQIEYLKKDERSPLEGLIAEEEEELESTHPADGEVEVEEVVVIAPPDEAPLPNPEELQEMAEEAAEDVEAYNDRED